MKLAAVALDYDGTIAVDGVMDPAVRSAIAHLRDNGIAVLLVTGRRLADLTDVAGDLSCFDVVVAENGAVLQFPATGRHTLIGHSPGAAFLAELSRRGIAFVAGESVIEAHASEATAILDAIQGLEQPLMLAFNRGRLMVLPPAIAKSSGLRHALYALRLSIHNTIAIGDAENDHDLLDACEVGVAVQWGSRALRAVADEVIRGSGPAAVATYLDRLADQPQLSSEQMGRRRLFLGHEHGGEAVSLAVRGRTMLIAGEPGTGKSWLAGLVCEQLILQGYCVCIIDPEGDYRPLETLPEVIVMGGDDPPPHAREFVRALRHPDVSVIIDLSRLGHRRKVEYLETLWPLLTTLRQATGLPHRVLVDEAHYFLGRRGSARAIDLERGGFIFVTYRISDLDPAIRAVRDAVVFVTRESDPGEARALVAMCRPGPSAVSSATLRDLHLTEAALLPGTEEAGGRLRRFQLMPRLTEHVRHRSKYLDMPVPEEHAFVFTDGGTQRLRARSLKEFVDSLAAASPESLGGHMRRHDFSRWLDAVFRDGPLASRISVLEEQAQTEDVADVAASIAQAIRARYDTASVIAASAAQKGPAELQNT